MTSGDNYRVALHASINSISELEWDALLPTDDLLHTHRFIRAVEEAGVENSQFWYLMFYDQNKLVGSAALSAFVVDLDLLLEGPGAELIRWVRRRRPGFLKIKVLFCGLPVSLGQSNLRVSDPRHIPFVCAQLNAEMEKIAATEGIKFSCIKEFTAQQQRQFQPLKQLGYFSACSLPYMEMNLSWPSFKAYLAALRHNYRRNIRRSLKKLNWEEPLIMRQQPRGVALDRPVLLVGKEEFCTADQFYRLYRAVLQRAETKLEELNLPFFELINQYLSEDIQYLVFKQQDRITGAAMLTINGPALTFLLVGMEPPRENPHDPYFNLIYGILSLAIQGQYRTLKLGQTAYWVKQRIGAQPADRYFYFKAGNKWMHLLLRSLKGVIFPRLKLPSVRVFKHQATI